MRVGQRGDRARLALKPLECGIVPLHGLRNHLDRDLTLEPCVAGAIHLAHASDADEGEDLIGAEKVPGASCIAASLSG
jgi:hypothetical protein